MTLVTDCETLHLRLRDLKVTAEQDSLFSDAFSVDVLKGDCRYTIKEGDETFISCCDPEWVTLYVNELVNFRLAQRMKDYVKIHAACGSYNGKRFLLVGEKGAGKTTCITRCLFENIAACGDEEVLVKGCEVIPLPRKFHLKEGTVPLVPQLGSIWNRLTSYPTSYGVRLCFFDPLDACFKWETKWGEVDTIFYLEPNHGELTQVETCPRWLMTQRIISQSLDFATDPESQIADLCEIVAGSDCFLMAIGELDGAVRTIKGALS
ncbi:MAG: hypothetical protein U5R49_09865 [Deltaproteobacteria bacterium]|nr:hypothetical protein [Deltaproteobacteria bacterium]